MQRSSFGTENSEEKSQPKSQNRDGVANTVPKRHTSEINFPVSACFDPHAGGPFSERLTGQAGKYHKVYYQKSGGDEKAHQLGCAPGDAGPTARHLREQRAESDYSSDCYVIY
jgi:hypothetical protein